MVRSKVDIPPLGSRSVERGLCQTWPVALRDEWYLGMYNMVIKHSCITQH